MIWMYFEIHWYNNGWNYDHQENDAPYCLLFIGPFAWGDGWQTMINTGKDVLSSVSGCFITLDLKFGVWIHYYLLTCLDTDLGIINLASWSLFMKYPITPINKLGHDWGAQIPIAPYDRLLPTGHQSHISSKSPALRGLFGLRHLPSPLQSLKTAVDNIWFRFS